MDKNAFIFGANNIGIIKCIVTKKKYALFPICMILQIGLVGETGAHLSESLQR